MAVGRHRVRHPHDEPHFAPTEYLDITASEARKRRACFAHASQDPERFYKLQEMVARMRGAECVHGYAEAFVRHLQSPAFSLPPP